MKKKRTFPGLWMLCMAAAAVCMLLFFRITAEQADRACSVALLQEDLTLLAEHNGLSQGETLAALEAGDVYVIQPDGLGYGPDGRAAFAAGLDAAYMDGLAYTDPGAPLAGTASISQTQLVVENITRTGVHAPKDFNMEHFGYGGRVLRGLYLFPNYRNRLAGEDPSAIADLLFLAATDRGMRLLILRPFEDAAGAVCTDLSVYRACLADLAARLEERGLTLGQGFSTMEARTEDRMLFSLLTACFAPILAGAWLLCRWEKLKKYSTPLVVCALLALAALWLWDHALTQKLAMLAAAVLLPAAGVWHLASLANTPWNCPKDRPFLLQALTFSGAVTGWALMGGLCVAALMSTRPYLLSADIFSGVKAALLAPVALMGLLLLWRLGRALIPRDRKGWLLLLCALTVAAAAALALVLRSGDGGPVSGIERTLRVWLERALYARPRTKELLLAAPCLPLYLWACRRRVPRLQLLGGLGCALELSSVCNTFCHATAPLRVSVTRTLLGAGLGLMLGLLACAVLELLWRKWGSPADTKNP